MNLPIYAQYIAYGLGLILFFWIWTKFSPMRSLIIALANAVFGFELLASITPQTPGLMVTLLVGAILVIFGIWGFILWFKQNNNKYSDKIEQTEAIENWWHTVKAFDMILVIGLILRIFIIQPFIVEGPSMDNNFADQEVILVDKLSYRLRQPSRGEVVIFVAPTNNKDDYIKRIIGLPGETVTIANGKVYVNNKQINEAFVSVEGKTPENATRIDKKVGIDEYFVMGDNRPHSSDSREWGTVPRKNLVGRAIVAVYPFDMFGLIKTPTL
jgi:signal peptidase I